MEKQRIRYIKKGDQLVSKNELYSTKGSRYLVYLNLDTMTYLIRNSVSLRKYEGGEKINNLIVLKRVVKKHLAHLGVKFGKEVRARSFGLCPVGFTESENRRLKREAKEKLDNESKKD